jgi:[ribosomal protein S18]-alanine N-acetyltransferase
MESAQRSLSQRPIEGRDVEDILAIQIASPEIAHWTPEDYESLSVVGMTGWVAEWDGAIAGFLVARQMGHEIEVLNIAVRPDRRRRGVGDALIRLVFTWAKSLEARKIFLEVRASNLIALRFYERHGFEETGRRPRYYSNPAEDAFVLAAKVCQT